MNFELSVFIKRNPNDVFAFFRDKDEIRQKKGSPVIIIEKTSSGKTGTGTRYREVVQILPWLKGEIFSEIIEYEEGKTIKEEFWGAGMKGNLTYQFIAHYQDTKLIQKEKLSFTGMLFILSPLLYLLLYPRLKERLNGIKQLLENEP
jgi:hypothetical protein